MPSSSSSYALGVRYRDGIELYWKPTGASSCGRRELADVVREIADAALVGRHGVVAEYELPACDLAGEVACDLGRVLGGSDARSDACEPECERDEEGRLPSGRSRPRA